jgi:two-component system chemotaxis response regulator CheB
LERGTLKLGEISPYTCPECHGVLARLREGNLLRFRCHTGHAFSGSALLASIGEQLEEKLWDAARSG